MQFYLTFEQSSPQGVKEPLTRGNFSRQNCGSGRGRKQEASGRARAATSSSELSVSRVSERASIFFMSDRRW